MTIENTSAKSLFNDSDVTTVDHNANNVTMTPQTSTPIQPTRKTIALSTRERVAVHNLSLESN